jgi:transposase
MPRPSKLDDLTAQRIYAAVAKGYPRDTAAKLAMIAPRTLYDWLRRGRSGEDGYAQFLQRVQEAESKGEGALVDLLRDTHAKTSWQACAWLLERRRPKVWGPRKAGEAQAAKPGEVLASSEERMALLESLMAAERSAAG